MAPEHHKTGRNAIASPPTRRALLVLFTVALVLRLAFLGVFYSIGDAVDTDYVTDGWDTVARNLIERGILAWGDHPDGPTMTRSPAYPSFLGLLILISGGRLWLMRLLYLALDATLAVLVVWLGVRATRSRDAALAGGYLYAVCLLPAWQIARLSPDGFFAAILTVSLVLFVRHLHGAAGAAPRWHLVALSGVTLGLAVLTKKTILLLVPVWILLALARHRFARRTIMATIIYVAAAALVVAPWLYRNYRLAGRPVPLQTLAWTVYWYGDFVDDNVERLGSRRFNRDARDYITGLAGDGLDLPAYALSVEQDLAREATLRALAVRQLREHPARVAAKTGRNLVRLWYLTETGRMTRYTRIAGACAFLLFALGAAILARNRRLGGAAALLLVTVLYFNLVYAPFFAILRYLIPVVPLVCVFGGATLAAVARREY